MKTVTYATGYFARAGKPDNAMAKATKVHALKNGKAMCGYRPHKTMSFQWNSNGLVYGYIDCPSCKKLAAEILQANLPVEKKAKKLPQIEVNSHERKILDSFLGMVIDSDYYTDVRPKGMSQKQCDAAAKSLWEKLGKI